jgi:hypothetical protein
MASHDHQVVCAYFAKGSGCIEASLSGQEPIHGERYRILKLPPIGASGREFQWPRCPLPD